MPSSRTGAGAALVEETQPRLFAEIRATCALSGQVPPPAQVRLTRASKITVDDEGGFLGLGRRRVLTIGLPALQLLAPDELRVVLTHALGGAAPPAAQALALLHAHEATYDRYWQDEVAEVLAQGYRPPLCEGFAQYLTSTAGRASAATPVSLEEPRALALLDDVAHVEQELLGALLPDHADMLVPIAWDVVDRWVYAAGWDVRARELRELYAGIRLGELPSDAQLGELGLRGAATSWDGPAPTDLVAEGARLLVVCACASLVGRGFTAVAVVGEPLELMRVSDGARWQPFERIERVLAGEQSRDEWRQACAALGIAELDVGAEPPPPEPPPGLE